MIILMPLQHANGACNLEILCEEAAALIKEIYIFLRTYVMVINSNCAPALPT